MTVPVNLDIDSFVQPGGSIVLAAQFETFLQSGVEQPVSGVQITITPAEGGAAVVGPTSTGIIEVDSATYHYQWLPAATLTPDDYVATWTGTGPNGTLTITQAVRVVQPPSQTPIPGVYATLAQYRNYIKDTITPDWLVEAELVAASEVIDLAMIGAVYPTDADSMPTYPAHIDMFMRACCAQAHFQIGNADPANVKSQYASTSMAGATATRTQRAQGQILPPLAPRAALILRISGAQGTAPLISW